MPANTKKMGRKAIVLLLWLLIWEAAALLAHNSFLLVTPFEAIRVFARNCITLAFWETVLFSLLRILGGFFLAFVFGITLGALGHFKKAAGEFLAPLMTVLKAVPVACFVVLLLIWFGSERLPFIISFLVALPAFYHATKEGLQAVDPKEAEVFWVYPMSGKAKFVYLYQKTAGKYLAAVLSVTLGTCIRAGVAAEVIGVVANSIGGAIYFAKVSFDTGELFAWTFGVVLLSYGLETLLSAVFEWYLHLPVSCPPKEVCETPGVVTVEGLTKSFGDRKVLEDYRAVFEENTINVLRWPSGTGKTTLFRLLAGLDKPDAGTMQGPKKVAFLFQEDRLLENLSALQNLALVCGDRERIRTELAKLLDEEALTKPVRELSGGMKRRVALCRAMLAAGDIVLLDEPFTGMDEETAKRAKAFIEEHKRGRAVIVATHSIRTGEETWVEK